LLLGGLIAILAAVVLLLPVLTNTFVRPQVVAVLRDTFTGEPAMDRLAYSLFSGVEIEGLRIGNPPGFSPGHCIAVERLTVDPSLLALFKGVFLFPKGLRATKPQVLVEQDAQGRLNLANLLKGGGGETPLVFGSVFTDDLGISIKTPALDRPVALSPMRVEVRVEDLDKPITFAVKNSDASLDVKGNATIASGGKVNLEQLKAELDYVITPALLAPLKPVLASAGPVKKFEGTLAGSGRVTLNGLARPAGKGQLALDVQEMAMLVATGGTNVLQTLRPGLTQLRYEFKPRGDRQTDLDLSLASPAASVAFKGAVTNDPMSPALEADITMTADIAALAERFPGYLATGRKLQGRIAGGVKGLKASAKSFAADVDFRGEGLAEIGPDGAPVPLVKDRHRLGVRGERNPGGRSGRSDGKGPAVHRPDPADPALVRPRGRPRGRAARQRPRRDAVEPQSHDQQPQDDGPRVALRRDGHHRRWRRLVDEGGDQVAQRLCVGLARWRGGLAGPSRSQTRWTRHG
jgi:hypothetical protein